MFRGAVLLGRPGKSGGRIARRWRARRSGRDWCRRPYSLARDHASRSVRTMHEAEWLAGLTALRFVDNATPALAHLIPCRRGEVPLVEPRRLLGPGAPPRCCTTHRRSAGTASARHPRSTTASPRRRAQSVEPDPGRCRTRPATRGDPSSFEFRGGGGWATRLLGRSTGSCGSSLSFCAWPRFPRPPGQHRRV